MIPTAPRRRPTPGGWAVPFHLGVRAAAVALLAATALACSDGGQTEVSGVGLEVPSGWSEVTAPSNPGVVAAGSWRGGREDASSLQIVVGCGPGTASDLAGSAITEPREPLEVTDAEVETDLEVAGADDALGLELLLGAGRDDDAATLIIDGVYAEVGDALVLVELATPVRDRDAEAVEAVLGSIDLDPDVLRAACEVD